MWTHNKGIEKSTKVRPVCLYIKSTINIKINKTIKAIETKKMALLFCLLLYLTTIEGSNENTVVNAIIAGIL